MISSRPVPSGHLASSAYFKSNKKHDFTTNQAIMVVGGSGDIAACGFSVVVVSVDHAELSRYLRLGFLFIAAYWVSNANRMYKTPFQS